MTELDLLRQSLRGRCSQSQEVQFSEVTVLTSKEVSIDLECEVSTYAPKANLPYRVGDNVYILNELGEEVFLFNIIDSIKEECPKPEHQVPNDYPTVDEKPELELPEEKPEEKPNEDPEDDKWKDPKVRYGLYLDLNLPDNTLRDEIYQYTPYTAMWYVWDNKTEEVIPITSDRATNFNSTFTRTDSKGNMHHNYTTIFEDIGVHAFTASVTLDGTIELNGKSEVDIQPISVMFTNYLITPTKEKISMDSYSMFTHEDSPHYYKKRDEDLSYYPVNEYFYGKNNLVVLESYFGEDEDIKWSVGGTTFDAILKQYFIKHPREAYHTSTEYLDFNITKSVSTNPSDYDLVEPISENGEEEQILGMYLLPLSILTCNPIYGNWYKKYVQSIRNENYSNGTVADAKVHLSFEDMFTPKHSVYVGMFEVGGEISVGKGYNNPNFTPDNKLDKLKRREGTVMLVSIQDLLTNERVEVSPRRVTVVSDLSQDKLLLSGVQDEDPVRSLIQYTTNKNSELYHPYDFKIFGLDDINDVINLHNGNIFTYYSEDNYLYMGIEAITGEYDITKSSDSEGYKKLPKLQVCTMRSTPVEVRFDSINEDTSKWELSDITIQEGSEHILATRVMSDKVVLFIDNMTLARAIVTATSKDPSKKVVPVHVDLATPDDAYLRLVDIAPTPTPIVFSSTPIVSVTNSEGGGTISITKNECTIGDNSEYEYVVELPYTGDFKEYHVDHVPSYAVTVEVQPNKIMIRLLCKLLKDVANKLLTLIGADNTKWSVEIVDKKPKPKVQVTVTKDANIESFEYGGLTYSVTPSTIQVDKGTSMIIIPKAKSGFVADTVTHIANDSSTVSLTSRPAPVVAESLAFTNGPEYTIDAGSKTITIYNACNIGITEGNATNLKDVVIPFSGTYSKTVATAQASVARIDKTDNKLTVVYFCNGSPDTMYEVGKVHGGKEGDVWAIKIGNKLPKPSYKVKFVTNPTITSYTVNGANHTTNTEIEVEHGASVTYSLTPKEGSFTQNTGPITIKVEAPTTITLPTTVEVEYQIVVNKDANIVSFKLDGITYTGQALARSKYSTKHAITDVVTKPLFELATPTDELTFSNKAGTHTVNLTTRPAPQPSIPNPPLESNEVLLSVVYSTESIAKYEVNGRTYTVPNAIKVTKGSTVNVVATPTSGKELTLSEEMRRAGVTIVDNTYTIVADKYHNTLTLTAQTKAVVPPPAPPAPPAVTYNVNDLSFVSNGRIKSPHDWVTTHYHENTASGDNGDDEVVSTDNALEVNIPITNEDKAKITQYRFVERDTFTNSGFITNGQFKNISGTTIAFESKTMDDGEWTEYNKEGGTYLEVKFKDGSIGKINL